MQVFLLLTCVCTHYFWPTPTYEFDLPICAEGLLPIFLGLAASLMRSISCSYLFRSRSAFSLASFSADSRALTRSTVARSLFSILGISPRRLALSRSSYSSKHTSLVATTEAEGNFIIKRSPCGHLLMSLGELLQVVLQEADLLFVGGASLGIL